MDEKEAKNHNHEETEERKYENYSLDQVKVMKESLHTLAQNLAPIEKIQRAKPIISFFISDPIQQKEWKNKIFHWTHILYRILIFVTEKRQI